MKESFRIHLADAKCELEKREIACDTLKESLERYLKQERVDQLLKRAYELKIIIKEAEIEIQQLEIEKQQRFLYKEYLCK